MSIKVTGKQFDAWVPDIKEALDKAFAEHLIATQRRLVKNNPKDTGRMASSWFIGRNQPDLSTRPEDWAEPGDKRTEVQEFGGQVKFDGTWYISNNVPYAERVALDPLYAKGGAGGPDWYTRIANSRTADFNKRADKHLRKV